MTAEEYAKSELAEERQFLAGLIRSYAGALQDRHAPEVLQSPEVRSAVEALLELTHENPHAEAR